MPESTLAGAHWLEGSGAHGWLPASAMGQRQSGFPLEAGATPASTAVAGRELAAPSPGSATTGGPAAPPVPHAGAGAPPASTAVAGRELAAPSPGSATTGGPASPPLPDAAAGLPDD